MERANTKQPQTRLNAVIPLVIRVKKAIMEISFTQLIGNKLLVVSYLFLFGMMSVFAENEPNNTWQTANDFLPGSSITGSLGYNDDHVDWYKVTIPYDGELKVWGTPEQTLDIQINIVDADGTSFIGERYASFSNGITDTTRFVKLKAGTYYLHISDWYSYGSYTLTNKLIPTGIPNGNDAEPNDEVAFANNFAINSTTTGHLGYFQNGKTDDVDWCKITLPYDGELKVWGIPDKPLDIQVNIIDADGTSFIGDRYSNFSNGITDTTRFVRLKAGTYFLHISHWYSYGSYTLTNKFTPTGLPDGNDAEPNDEVAFANSFTINSTTTGHLGYFQNGRTDDVDWYKITLPYDGELKVWGVPDKPLDIQVNIIDADGTSFIGDRYASFSNGITDTTRFVRLKAGTYFLHISDWYSYGSYTLTNKFTPTGLPDGNDAEPNDTYSQAGSLTVGQAKTGHIGYFKEGKTDDQDWYKITLSHDDDLYVWGVPDPTLDIQVHIIDKDGTSFIGNRISSNDKGITDTTLCKNLKAGTYYVQISAWYSYGSYRLMTQLGSSLTPLPVIQLFSPNGGEIWQAGNTQIIQWTSSNLQNVKIEYSIDNGSNWITLTNNYPASNGSYEWLIPDTPANQCRVKISNADGTNQTTSQSTGVFTIVKKPVNTGLLAFYPFQGNVNDESGNSFHGTFVSATSASDRFGISGNAYEFNGKGDHLKLPNMVSQSFTVNFWIKTTMQGIFASQWHGGNGLIDAEVSGNMNDWGTSLIDGGKVAFGIGPNDLTIKSTKTVNDGKWHMITATRDIATGEFKLYIDGKPEASGEAGKNELNSAKFIGVGNDASGIDGNVRWFAGTLDDVRFYGSALSVDEILPLYDLTTSSANRSLPKECLLKSNYPNPFNETTQINFTVPAASFVSMKIYTLMGTEVAILLSEEIAAGEYSKQWVAKGLPSGIYLCQLRVGAISTSKKMVLIR